MGTVSLRTLGCRLNQAESDEILIALADRGIAVDDTSPDVVVVNTCTVTSEASSASRKLIRRSIKDNPNATVVVTGCYAVAHEAEVRSIPGVATVLPTKVDLPAAVVGHLGERNPVGFRFVGPRRNLKVQTGCDEMCTFCIVPTTRGGLFSLPASEVLEHARRLVGVGARELILSGVHLGTYRSSVGLTELIRRLSGIDGLARIRLSSIEASHVDDGLLELIADDPKLCRHLHLPLQTGSETTWMRMKRPGTLDGFIQTAERARSVVPGVAITTDVMVGFPGETDSDFEQTLDVVTRIGFERLHVFRYSARKGTQAATFPDQIPHDVRRERSAVVREAGSEIRRRWLESHVGMTADVLVERITGSTASGHTDTYAGVRIEHVGASVGDVISVEVSARVEGVLVG